MSNHVSKIDMRNNLPGFECPFQDKKSVRCANTYEQDPHPWNQYVCECIEDEPAPQSRRGNK